MFIRKVFIYNVTWQIFEKVFIYDMINDRKEFI